MKFNKMESLFISSNIYQFSITITITITIISTFSITITITMTSTIIITIMMSTIITIKITVIITNISINRIPSLRGPVQLHCLPPRIRVPPHHTEHRAAMHHWNVLDRRPERLYLLSCWEGMRSIR